MQFLASFYLPHPKKKKTKQNKTKEGRKRKERNEILILYFCNADIDRIQAHFKNIQMISDTITLPHAMHYLSCRIAEDLDLSELLERLIQGKGQPNALTNSEKLELWGRLKIISMTLTWICHSAYLLLCYIVLLLWENWRPIFLYAILCRFYKNGTVSMGNNNA